MFCLLCAMFFLWGFHVDPLPHIILFFIALVALGCKAGLSIKSIKHYKNAELHSNTGKLIF